jgi:cysteine desulfurase / selenocysteine lyase
MLVSEMSDFEKLREDFPILKRKVHGKSLVYLDNAATTQKPRQVIESIKDYYENSNSNVHRAVHQLSQEATDIYDKAHEKVAYFIGAKGMQEIVFTKNTTEALNIVANSFVNKLKDGDEIVLTQMEHHSNLVPWQQVAKKTGAKIRFAEITENGELDMDKFKEIVGDKTKVVSFTHVSNVLGTINPVKEMISIAKGVGAVTVVDAAQSVPHMPVDVKDLDCDFMAFSGHKMLGPTGIGVLYGKEEVLENTEPLLYGGDMISEVSFEDAKWNDLPWKFEAGTPNIAGAVGLGAAVDYLTNIGLENIQEREKVLTEVAIKKLQEIEGLTIYGPVDNRGGLISFNIDGVHPHDVSALLDSEGIAVRGGHHCAMPLAKLLSITGSVRVSFYFYNTIEEIEKFAEVLAGIRTKMEALAVKGVNNG